jgi:peptidoglycan/xylan/chitin deacetylase (PgdA/CDA1 family)
MKASLSVALALVTACSAPNETAPPAPSIPTPVDSTPAPLLAPALPPQSVAQGGVANRHVAQIDGRAFPDHVLALTWDDGPDAGTLRLARYLAGRHVSATFFVVQEWSNGLSEEPGLGERKFQTGYAHLPILGDIVALGHRLGNHTANHVLLSPAAPEVVAHQLRDNQSRIDPFLTNELRLFRAPGGAWDERAAAVVDGDPVLASLVGPIRWDIDGKDWEGSLYCRSDRPLVECEPAGPGHTSRVRAEVIAKRYLDAIDSAGHGIVLFHDRVGDVGSDYAMRVATHVVPELEARGYVFAAPVLAFSPFKSRASAVAASHAPLRGDLNGDGREDECRVDVAGVSCALAGPHGLLGASTWLARTADSAPWLDGGLFLADVNGDRRADLCSRVGKGLACALAP